MSTVSRGVYRFLSTLVLSITLLIPAQPTFAADTEIAHVWRFTYQQSTGAGTLDVMIVEHDRETHDILRVLEEFAYAVPCNQARTAITCDLDIRSALIDSYLQMGLKDAAARVRPSEAYRWMIVEMSGHWQSIPANSHTTVANHPSLHFGVTTSGNQQVRFLSNWTMVSTASPYFNISTGQSHTIRNEFDCFRSQPNDCTISNWLIAGGRPQVLNSRSTAVSTVGFLLAPTQITITPPDGYALDSLVIDPPKAGYG